MLDYRSKGPRFDPGLGHGDFLRVRDNYQNKNDRLDSVLAASKLKVLSRERLVKTQADLNKSPFH